MTDFVKTSSVAIGDGSTDDTAALQVLFNSHLLVLVDPAIGHLIAGSLTLRSGHVIVGVSRTKGFFGANPQQGALIASSKHGARNIRIQSLYMRDVTKTARTAGAGIYLDGSGDAAVVVVEDTTVDGFVDGIGTVALMQSRFSGNRQNLQLRDGWHNEGISTSVVVQGNYANGCKRHGIYANKLNYSTFQSCAADQCGADAYHFEQGGGGASRGVKLIACGAEQNQGNGVYLDGIGFSLSACAISGGRPGTSCILINGAGNVNIDNACYLRNGDYGVNLAAIPKYGCAPKSVELHGSPYFYQQNIAPVNDPFSGLVQK